MHKHGGIVFYSTTDLERLSIFYTDQVGAKLWLDQGGCRVFKFGNMLFGFCQRDNVQIGALLTFFYPEKKLVDDMFRKLSNIATTPVKENDNYRIYHFYAEDPDGRPIEFQYFWDNITL